MVILEALSVDCPVVASKEYSKLPDCVQSAYLDDKQAWIDAISNPINEGLKEAVAKHHIDIVSKQWGDVYDKIIDSRASTE